MFCASRGNPFILVVKGQGYESQKRCRCGSLHSCECWLLLVLMCNAHTQCDICYGVVSVHPSVCWSVSWSVRPSVRLSQLRILSKRQSPSINQSPQGLSHQTWNRFTNVGALFNTMVSVRVLSLTSFLLQFPLFGDALL